MLPAPSTLFKCLLLNLTKLILSLTLVSLVGQYLVTFDARNIKKTTLTPSVRGSRSDRAMKPPCLLFFVVGLWITLLGKVTGNLVREKVSNVSVKSSQVAPIPLVTCRNDCEDANQCVRIEDCKVRRRRGYRRFCRWEGEPTHSCYPKELRRLVDTRDTRGRYVRFRDNFHADYPFSEEFRWKTNDFRNQKNERRQGKHYDHKDFDSYESDWTDDDDDKYNDCGIPGVNNLRKNINSSAGGVTQSMPGSNPWMAAVGERRNGSENDWFCGGVLISRRIVLTAAHCVTMRTANVVRVGDIDLFSNNDKAEPQESSVELTIVHPGHKDPTFYHDIAVLRLATPMRYTKHVRPVCLPSNPWNTFKNALVTLTGWGTVAYENQNKHILQEVQLQVISNTECNGRYAALIAGASARTLPRGIIRSQVCAGDRNGGRDACEGDSGGPIVTREGRKRVVVGLVSSGLDCGSKIYPGIYTRVSHYMPWICRFL